MTKAEFILESLERGEFYILSELEIIKRATTQHPDKLELLHQVYSLLGHFASGDFLEKEEEHKPAVDNKPGTIVAGCTVKVIMPTLKEYLDSNNTMSAYLRVPHPQEEEFEKLKQDNAEKLKKVDIAKIDSFNKEYIVESITDQGIELQGMPKVLWALEELQFVKHN